LVGQRETQAAAAKRFMIVESVFNTDPSTLHGPKLENNRPGRPFNAAKMSTAMGKWVHVALGDNFECV
jgi:hypothetical protein